MGVFEAIFGAIALLVLAYLLIVLIPVVIGKLLFRWSGQRMRYIISQSMSTIVGSVVGSLVLTGFILLIGVVFNQQWAFSGGLLLVYTFWTAIKAVKENIKASKGM